jgi:hypothetical protein
MWDSRVMGLQASCRPLLPSPLAGEGQGGGSVEPPEAIAEALAQQTPHPGPPPQGGREKEGPNHPAIQHEPRRLTNLLGSRHKEGPGGGVVSRALGTRESKV